MQKKHGFKPLGAADGPVKSAIFGETNARLYKYEKRTALATDRLAVHEEGLRGRGSLPEQSPLWTTSCPGEAEMKHMADRPPDALPVGRRRAAAGGGDQGPERRRHEEHRHGARGVVPPGDRAHDRDHCRDGRRDPAKDGSGRVDRRRHRDRYGARAARNTGADRGGHAGPISPATAIGVAVRQGAPLPDISTTEAFKQSILAAKSLGLPGPGARAPRAECTSPPSSSAWASPTR